MDTRILRMAAGPCWKGDRDRLIQPLGQLQPVIFFIKNGEVWLRIEGTVDRNGEDTWCYWSFRLADPEQKARAKAHFAHLEQCRRDGTKTHARHLWDEYCAKRDAKKVAA